MALRLCEKRWERAAFLCLSASHARRLTLRHWPRVTEQGAESGQKLRDESCRARGPLCMCVSVF